MAKQTKKTVLKDDEKEVKSMSGTLLKYRTKYEPSISAGDRKSLNNGDDVAHLLAGLEPKDVIATAERLLDMKAGELMTKYEHLNRGQQRMNAGNRIRGAVKRGEATIAQVKKAIKA